MTKDEWDTMFVRGAALIVLGLALIYPPAAYLFAGAASIVYALAGAWIATKQAEPKPAAPKVEAEETEPNNPQG